MAGIALLDSVMGLWHSHPRRMPEREPLLPTATRRDQLPPPQSSLDKAVDITAAVSAGKLPSNDQLARTLQFFLKFLRTDPVPGGDGHLSQRSRKLVEDVEEIAQATLQISTELNYDDKLQDLVFQTSNVHDGPLRVDLEKITSSGAPPVTPTLAPAPPTTEELNKDVETVVKSVKTLLRLVATSATFRLILTDLLQSLRETINEFAADVERVALQVQIGAEKVRDASRLDDATLATLKGKVKEAAQDVDNVGEITADRWATLDPAQKTKDLVIGRIQEAIHRAQHNPKYRSALHSILLILRKYVEGAKLAATVMAQSTDPDAIVVKPVVSIDERADLAFADLKTLLERAASGLSLDPFLQSLSDTITHVISAPAETGRELRDYFSSLAIWLDRALFQPEYPTSLAGVRAAERLYDRGRILFTASNAQWAKDMRLLTNCTDEYLSALQANRATLRFVRSLDAFSSDVVQFGRDAMKGGAASRKMWREELWKDAIGWLVPKLLRSLHAIPMPRVEFKNDIVDVAIDSLWLTAPSDSAALVPDHLWVHNWSEVRLDFVNGRQSGGKHRESSQLNHGTLRSSTRMQIHIDGIRFSAHDIGYYFKYKGLIGYYDEGLLSIDVGGLSIIGQGISIDVDLEMVSKSCQTSSGHPFFSVRKVKVDLRGLKLSINKSKHWILNKIIVQPLAGPVVRRIVARGLERQIQRGLEAAGNMVKDVAEAADRRNENCDEGATLEDYWGAFLEKVALLLSSPMPDDPGVTTHTAATLKGIIRTTVTQPSPEASHPSTPSETVVAIGGGAQIFPGVGGPYDEQAEATSTANAVKGAVDRVVEKSGETTETLKASAVKEREGFSRAEERKEVRERVERRRRGWRSHAFDLES